MTDDPKKRLKMLAERMIDRMDVPTVNLLSAFASGMIMFSMWNANNFSEPEEAKETDVEDLLVKILVKIIERGCEKR